MTTITLNKQQAAPILGHGRQFKSGWQQFVAELAAIASVIFTPRRVLREVDAMIALHRQAAKLDATDPVAAAELRQRAARIGL